MLWEDGGEGSRGLREEILKELAFCSFGYRLLWIQGNWIQAFLSRGDGFK